MVAWLRRWAWSGSYHIRDTEWSGHLPAWFQGTDLCIGYLADPSGRVARPDNLDTDWAGGDAGLGHFEWMWCMLATALAPVSEIRTARLVLRALRTSDAGLIALYASDVRLARMTMRIPHPYPPGLAETFIEKCLQPEATEAVWALDSAIEGLNGFTGLASLKLQPDGFAEVGYWAAPALWGGGLAKEAVEALAAHARSVGLAGLRAEVLQDNERSIQVLLRSGFTFTGTGEARSVARGAIVPTFRYCLMWSEPGS